jgi:glycosyltransferase involved in cell wall biosynthesis
MALAIGLSLLDTNDERFYFYVYRDDYDWLKPFIGANSELLCGPESPKVSVWRRRAKLAIQQCGMSRLLPVRQWLPQRSDGTIERADIDVVDFTLQHAFLTAVPSIYHPQDLQHLHYPEFFSPAAIRARERLYRTYCKQANIVVALSTWCKNDLVTNYQLPLEKVVVVPVPPILTYYPQPSLKDVVSLRHEFSLPTDFILFPAQIFRHKNHARLLEALALLRDRYRLIVPLVCCGGLTDDYATILVQTARLGLRSQVFFLGFVEPLKLVCLYRMAKCLVFPSLFEGWGIPIVEAMEARLPVACSRVTSIPDLVGDTALLFDPTNIEDMAHSIARLWSNAILREDLAIRASTRVQNLSPRGVARISRAVYRRAAGIRLTMEDQDLLSSKPFV